MPIEIKGLREGIESTRQLIRDARNSSSGLSDSIRELNKNMAEAKKQIDQANSDLVFEMTQLGNSPPNEPEEKKGDSSTSTFPESTTS